MILINQMSSTNDENQVTLSVELVFSKDGAAPTSKYFEGHVCELKFSLILSFKVQDSLFKLTN